MRLGDFLLWSLVVAIGLGLCIRAAGRKWVEAHDDEPAPMRRALGAAGTARPVPSQPAGRATAKAPSAPSVERIVRGQLLEKLFLADPGDEGRESKLEYLDPIVRDGDRDRIAPR